MSYISVAEVNEFMWISWEDTLVSSLITYSEALLNTKLRVTTLKVKTYNEEHTYNGVWPYYLKELNPITLIKVNNVALQGDYKFYGRKLLLEYAPPLKNKWNVITFEYSAGFWTIPDDIKQVMLMLVSWIYNKRKSVWIKGFNQWKISVQYNTQEEVNSFQNMLNLVITKYSKNDFYS